MPLDLLIKRQEKNVPMLQIQQTSNVILPEVQRALMVVAFLLPAGKDYLNSSQHSSLFWPIFSIQILIPKEVART